MSEFLAAMGILLCVLILLFLLISKGERSLSVELESALALVIESGCDVECRGYHLYRDKAGKYIVLTFKKEGKNFIPMEESFDNINDAIGKFAFRTKL